MARPTLPEVRFWRYVAISPFQEACWPWKGSVFADTGRGVLRFRGHDELAYRIAWILEYGDIPEGMFVLHSCDWPLCCNPFHLFLGTQTDNMADMRAKGRGFKFPVYAGEGHGRCIISDTQIIEMKHLYDSGHYSQATLAQMFKLGPTQVGRIIRGESRVLATGAAS